MFGRETGVIMKPVTLFSVPAAVLLISQQAGAITVREVAFDELCRRAEVIVCATAREIRTEASPDGNHVLTFTRFDELIWIKGQPAATGEGGDDTISAPQTYEICTLGGKLGNMVEKIPGMPTFEPGRRYVLFVQGNGESLCPLIGVHQGCFHVERSDDGSETVKTWRRRLITGLDAGKLRTTESTSDVQTSIRLDRFIDMIKQQLAGEASQ